jgi:hypothetical protein
MTALSAYTAIGGTGSTLSASQIPEILLQTYTVLSGVTSITVSETAFKLTNYKAIHVRFNNITTSGATSSVLYGYPIKNGTAVSGSYLSTLDSINSTTATGWTTNNSATPSDMRLTATGQDFSTGIPELNIYLNNAGMSSNIDVYNGLNSRRANTTVIYPSSPQAFSSSDYTGVIIGLNGGTFTGGTISVYGEV